jgi:phosphate transport system substrate-binding protein
MITILMTAMAFMNVAADPKSLTLSGAGATFPYPLYSKWAHQYEENTGVRINYQSIGSGGGIAQIKAKTVEFGASDAPLKKEELEEAGLIQFPMIMGGVVAVINLPGVSDNQLKLTPQVLADMFLGKITKWDDPKIKEANPELQLPNQAITVVHRADGSGTTWIFTNYLAKVSKEWADKVGADKAVEWPVGLGGKGNEGVAAYVQQTKGAIGYVEFAYALENKITTTALQNQAGQFVAPTIESFQAAASNADWQNAPGFYMVLIDQPGEKSWPITGASFILIHAEQPDSARAKAMLNFFDWCLQKGGATAEELHYVPMPANVVTLVQQLWKNHVKSGGKPVWP